MRTTLILAHSVIAAGIAAAMLLIFPAPVSTAGGGYLIEGGTSRQRAEVARALAASAFDWNVLPATIRVTITRGARATSSGTGEVRLGAQLLERGRASWGIVQHEFAHQVDFMLLDDADRTRLARMLGGTTWWPRHRRLRHSEYTCERFASTLAWAYWPSRDNVLRPRSSEDEAGAVEPKRFRSVVADILSLGYSR